MNFKKFVLEKEGFDFFPESTLKNSILQLNGFKSESDLEKIRENNVPVLSGIKELKELLIQNTDKKVVVIGDYDGDGICGTTIFIKMLRYLNISCDYVIPTREQGFGMSKTLVDIALTKNADIILTVDNGSKAIDAIKYAKEKGIEVVVTDHHDIDDRIYTLTDVFINPHKPDTIGFNEICGAMVAYLCAREILDGIVSRGEMRELMELASVATVTDVMPLWYLNRNSVSNFINNVRKGIVKNEGLNSIINIAKVSKGTFSASSIGFKIGPMFNAPGRLENATIPIELLLSNNSAKINEISNYCLEINEKRKKMTKELLDKVVLDDSLVNVAVFDDAHEGLIGIIAGNLTEKTSCPSFVFTKTKTGTYKGSGRSPLNYNLIEGATKVLSTNDLAVGYGGHSGAMGLTLKDLNSVMKFKKLMNADYINSRIEPLCTYFLEYPRSKTPEEVFEEISSLEPFGEKFNEPIFHLKGNINSFQFLKETHTSFKMMYNFDEKKFMNFWYFKNIVKETGKYDIYFTLSKEGNNVSSHIVEMFKVEEDKNV